MDYSFRDTLLVGQNYSESTLTIIDGVIKAPKILPKLSFSLNNEYYIYPAFINSTDIVSHTLYHRLNTKDIKITPPYKEILDYPIYNQKHILFSQIELLQLNQIKNIMSGCLGVYYPEENMSMETYQAGFLDPLVWSDKKISKIWTPINQYPLHSLSVIGTHSNAIGAKNILELIQYPAIKEKSNLLDLITKNPAQIFNINMGDLSNNSIGNFLIIKKLSQNPINNLLKIKLSDIALVVYQGLPIYGDIEMLDIAKKLQVNTAFNILVDHKEKFLSLRGAQKILKKLETHIGILPQLPIQIL